MSVIETHSARNPRLLAIHGLLALMLAVLGGGLAYRQLFKSGVYTERGRVQSQRRVIVPGPRGNIYDRDGNLLVGNRPRFSVVLNLAELRSEFAEESQQIRKNYASFEPRDRPSSAQRYQIARTAVVQRYLDQVNAIIGRHEKVDAADIEHHYNQTLLLPFVLLDDLAPKEYARLIEQLPVNSPLQVYTSSIRYYPFGSAASHSLGYVGGQDNPEVEDFPGDELMTFKMRGTVGKTGLELEFDDKLQGEAGGAIYRVDPAGFQVNRPLVKRLPVQGHNITTSLDIDLQLAAEKSMEGRTGAAVALDVHTGEVLVMASKPDYDLNSFVPRISSTTWKEIFDKGGFLNRAIQGQYPPGSTFKIITSVAGLRSGAIDPDTSRTICAGYLMIGNRRFVCDKRSGHGERDLVGAIRDSCNVFFYKFGTDIGPELIAAEARRFGYGQPTGIELPWEFRSPVVPDPAWKKREQPEDGPWSKGDTANMAIGQGYTLVSPLQVACFVASFARGETMTVPTLIHDPSGVSQHTTPIGLSQKGYATIVEGMEQCAKLGTARLIDIRDMRVAAKTGTAQKGRIDLAWMIAFAPVENPQIAIAVVMEGSEEDASYHGGTYAAPVVKAVFETWRDKYRDGHAANRLAAGFASPAPVTSTPTE